MKSAQMAALDKRMKDQGVISPIGSGQTPIPPMSLADKFWSTLGRFTGNLGTQVGSYFNKKATPTPTPTRAPTPTATPTARPTVAPTVSPTTVVPNVQPTSRLFQADLQSPGLDWGIKPTATPTPIGTTVTPTPAPEFVPKFEFEKYFNIPSQYAGKVEQPPKEKAKMIFNAFEPTGEATPAAMAAWGENAMRPYDDFDPESKWYMDRLGGGKPVRNPDGSFDRGYFHSNDNTFNDMMTKPKYRDQLLAAGITKHQDVLDPQKATVVARVTREYERDAGVDPFAWWYGWWKGKGITQK